MLESEYKVIVDIECFNPELQNKIIASLPARFSVLYKNKIIRISEIKERLTIVFNHELVPQVEHKIRYGRFKYDRTKYPEDTKIIYVLIKSGDKRQWSYLQERAKSYYVYKIEVNILKELMDVLEKVYDGRQF